MLCDCCNLSCSRAVGAAPFWQSCFVSALPYPSCQKATTSCNIALFSLLSANKASLFPHLSERVERGRDALNKNIHPPLHPFSPHPVTPVHRLNARAEREIEYWCLCSLGLLTDGKFIVPWAIWLIPLGPRVGWQAVTQSQGRSRSSRCPRVNGMLVPSRSDNGEDISRSRDLFAMSGPAKVIWDLSPAECKE